MSKAFSHLAPASLVSLLLTLPAAWAHHSYAEYDEGKKVEIEGTLVEVKWQNPHVRLRVRAVAQPAAEPAIWDIEGSSLSVMSRTNATPEKLHIGEKVRVAGYASRTRPNRMDGHNVLLADGTELVLNPNVKPRWNTAAVGTVSTWRDPGTADGKDVGLFRVWSTKIDDPGAFFPTSYPLTEAGKKKAAAWDPLKDTITPGCEPKGMPTIMEQPYPMEFVRQKDTILLRIEEYDSVRTIHMDSKVTNASLPKGRLGRSTGHWEGKTLVVKTDGILWPYLDPEGTPLSPGATLLERFTPTPDGTRLEYSVVVTDPQYLTRPVELRRSWVARPNESVKKYDCTR